MLYTLDTSTILIIVFYSVAGLLAMGMGLIIKLTHRTPDKEEKKIARLNITSNTLLFVLFGVGLAAGICIKWWHGLVIISGGIAFTFIFYSILGIFLKNTDGTKYVRVNIKK